MRSTRQFCPTCGTSLRDRRIEGRERRYCPNCERPIYRNPKPAAGVLVVREESILLVERTNPPAVGHWSVPAGYLEVDEPPEVAAARELREETNVRVDPTALTLLETTFVEVEHRSAPVLVLVYTAPASATDGAPVAGSDAADAQFWRRAELGDIPLEPGYRDVFERAIETVE